MVTMTVGGSRSTGGSSDVIVTLNCSIGVSGSSSSVMGTSAQVREVVSSKVSATVVPE